MEKLKEKKIYRGGCVHCPGSKDILSLDTVLYWGFGGYEVYKNKKMYYMGDPNGKWEDYKTLAEIEKEAKKFPNARWEVELNNPLRGAKWRRNKSGQWLLKETNRGFA